MLLIVNTEKILSLIGTGILVVAFGIEAAIIGYVVTSVIGDLTDTYLGEGWGDIINGTLGFLALGLGAFRGRLMPEESIRSHRGGSGPEGFGETKGEYSGRSYSPERAGGPIEDLNWRDAEITQGGINDVKTHVSRFGEVPENAEMIDRLERIERGEIEPTDYDKRFYTHEVREYQRYRNLGIEDGVDPGYDVWNDTHSATLEDYKISDYNGNQHNLYTPEIANRHGVNR